MPPETTHSTEPSVVQLDGEIDMHESPQVREKFSQAVENRADRVLVDLTGVSYIDSSGLAVLIEAMQRIEEYGGKLALFGVRKNILTILEIARLDKVFSIFPDKATAIAA